MSAASSTEVLVQEVTICAPPERVFDVFTDPEARTEWWSAEGMFRTTRMDSDLRPGGRWLTEGVGRAGARFVVGGEYLEVERPRLLVFTWVRPLPDDPSETIVRCEFEEGSAGTTTLRVTHSHLRTPGLRERNNGWPLVLSLLRAYLEAHP